ncbi:MAG TPA: hypothetical protein VIV58_14555, partial [Kofleriaceae bacterium]
AYDELANLQQHAKQCGGVGGDCARTDDVAGVVACMNAAIASDTLAEALWSDELTGRDHYIFTEHDHFRVYDEYYASSGDSEILEEMTCTGPLKTTTTARCGEYFQLELDGC